MGKGAAIRTGLKHVEGDIVVIQDADLEYNPQEYDQILKLIIDDQADVVYGSRFINVDTNNTVIKINFLANKFLTLMANLLFGSSLTDMETCYKAFRSDFIKDIVIESNGFDFDPEITAKILKKKARFKEVPISYCGRTFLEGKKITWKDGFHAIFALIKYRFFC